MDYGLDMLAVLWGAFDELGNAYIYRELCKPNVIISDAAHMILNASQGERIVCTCGHVGAQPGNRQGAG